MKAIILAAGVGSRIRPLTDKNPKPLLPIGNTTIMGAMISGLQKNSVIEFAIVTGYREEQIKEYIQKQFANLRVTFIRNEKFAETNTGYSLLLAKEWVGESAFVKCDGDVVFEPEVMRRLIDSPYENCLTIDRNINLAAEEVKVILDAEGKIIKVGKKLPPQECSGESIGIEKLGREGGKSFFAELDRLMKSSENFQQYYDDSYSTLVAQGIPFNIIDITGLKWVEIDTHEDYQQAQEFFGI